MVKKYCMCSVYTKQGSGHKNSNLGHRPKEMAYKMALTPLNGGKIYFCIETMSLSRLICIP